MALGKFQINVALDTATDPDDTTLLAAPESDETIYIQWLAIIVTTLEAATTINIEDGVGGDVVASIASTALGTTVLEYANGPKSDGLRMTSGTLLNATTAGGTSLGGRVVGECIVR